MGADGFVKIVLFTAMSACVGWIIASIWTFELGWLAPSINAGWIEKAGPAGAMLGIAIYWFVEWVSRRGTAQ